MVRPWIAFSALALGIAALAGQQSPSQRDDTVPPDPLIRRAGEAWSEFTGQLPDFVCREVVTRYTSKTVPVRWVRSDTISSELVYSLGREERRNPTVDGKPVAKGRQVSPGAWSTGEFAKGLIDLFAPSTAADFHYARDSKTGGVNTRQYSFSVKSENSRWHVLVDSSEFTPPYQGSVWIEPANARVLRFESHADQFPGDFPVNEVESTTDYQSVQLGDAKRYLLPVRVETLYCEPVRFVSAARSVVPGGRTRNCWRNVIEFRDYHKYTGESVIRFDQP